MLFSGQGMIPTFILVKGVGLIDSRWAMVLPRLINTWNPDHEKFLHGFQELEEAAVIDGANGAQVLVKIVLPLSKASIATIGLFHAVSHWNAWFDAMPTSTPRLCSPCRTSPPEYHHGGFPVSRPGRRSIQLLDVVPPSQAIRAATIVITTLPHPGGIPVSAEIFCKRCNGRFCKGRLICGQPFNLMVLQKLPLSFGLKRLFCAFYPC